MNKYVDIKQAEDNMVKLVQDSADDYILALKQQVIIPPKGIFKYNSDVSIKLVDEDVKVPFITDNEIDNKYFCLIPPIRKTTDKISLEVYNLTENELVLNPDTILGHFWIVILATFTEKEEIPSYYKSDFLDIKELTPGITNNFTYVIDEKGFHKLVFLLNRHMYENTINSEFQLG